MYSTRKLLVVPSTTTSSVKEEEELSMDSSLELDQSYDSFHNNSMNGSGTSRTPQQHALQLFEENSLAPLPSEGGYHSLLQREEQLFAQALLRFEGQGDVFSMVEAFHSICYESVAAQRTDLQYDKQGVMSLQQLREQDRLSYLIGERNTWLLLHDLEQDRQAETVETDVIQRVSLSDRKLLDNEVTRDRELRQNLIIVKWLEAIVDEYDHDYFKQEVLWRHSFFTMQHNPSKLLVTEIDPDAATRQRKSLHSDDIDDEVHLLRRLWSLVREGKLHEAQQLCKESGQPWRAATLSGGELFSDSELVGESPSLEGNAFRNVWKMSCYQLSNETQLDPYERAIYATLCGNLEQILPVCKTWEDYLWAYYKVLVTSKVDKVLQERLNPLVTEDIAPIPFVEKLEQDIFSTLKSSSQHEVKYSAFARYHIIQEKIILGKIDDLFLLLADWIGQPGEKSGLCPPQILRFAAHLVLFFFEEGLASLAENESSQVLAACTHILFAYIQHLIQERQINLIALYTCKLPVPLQVPTYANFLKEIRDNFEREKCLLLAEKARLDVPKITKRVVEIIRESSHGVPTVIERDIVLQSSMITPEDSTKIRAIEWLCFDPSQRAEALYQSNALARVFLAFRKLEAANKLFDEILPQDSVAVVLEKTHNQVVSNSIKEHLCLRAYLDCHKAYSKWHSHHALCPPLPNRPSSERFAEELNYHEKLRVYTEQYAVWRDTDEALSKTARDTIFKVVTYPRGWLVDDDTPHISTMTEEAKERTRQLDTLRRQCLPDLFFILHRVLYETGAYQESLLLADMVADEYHKLYSLFTKEELGRLLFLIRSSCIELLEQKRSDPLGFK